MKFSIAKFAKSKYFVPGIVIGLVIFGWLILLIAGLGPFGEEKEKFVSQPTTWSQKEDYVIKETPEGKFVINEKAGLSFKVPEGWRVEMDESKGAQLLLVLFEKNVVLNQNGVPTGGCWWRVGIEDNKLEAKRVSQDINFLDSENNLIDMDYYTILREIINVDNYKTLKTTFKFNKTEQANMIEVIVPFEEKIYFFRAFLDLDKEEKCSQEFDKFLETVSIK